MQTERAESNFSALFFFAKKEENIMRKNKLLKNKVCAAILVGLGALSIPIENDATAFLFFLMIGVPMFFAKENIIE